MGSDGSQAELITLPGIGETPINRLMNGRPYLKMEGQKVFKAAVPVIARATKEALKSAGWTTDDVDVFIPEEYLGAISGDINSRRGRVIGMDTKGKLQVLKATAPIAEMFTYANDLRSITGGRGMYTMRFSHYEEVPHKIASTIISLYQTTKKQEEQ